MGVMCLNMKCTAHTQKCKTRTRNISSERAWWRMTGRKCRTWQHIDKLALSVCMCLDNRCLCSECVCVLVASTGEMPVCREVALTCFNTLHIPALFQHTSIERHIQRYTDKHCTHSHSQTHTHTRTCSRTFSWELRPLILHFSVAALLKILVKLQKQICLH